MCVFVRVLMNGQRFEAAQLTTKRFCVDYFGDI
jgi:hypothetical protein